jgi:hypothetical protein
MLDHLGDRGEECFFLAVQPLLSDPVSSVRRVAARHLARETTDLRVAAALESVLQNKTDEEVRHYARRGLRER